MVTRERNKEPHIAIRHVQAIGGIAPFAGSGHNLTTYIFDRLCHTTLIKSTQVKVFSLI